ncbi:MULTISPECIES: DUF177 domain-containing protein [unclassified Legionella]|uniref:YceD family protein n=1 Tax=unclassified Legionella TaxID=2622702 RepID=UPI00105596B9|nr:MULTISPECIES: YceD family protein [unclassified Legionella]MDI9818206.1 YceD family protein [Legionella sp. PL877]
MFINLKTMAAQSGQEQVNIKLQERLPAHVASPCSINCQFSVESFDHYYLLTLSVDTLLELTCQRCLKEFSYHYLNLTKLAICDSEEMAEELMERYECIVANNHIDLQELVTDELHLYAPELHPEMIHCDGEINKFIMTEAE